VPLFDWIVLSDSARRDNCHKPLPWSELPTIHLELHLSFPDEAISGADASPFPAQVEQWFQNGAGAYHHLGPADGFFPPDGDAPPNPHARFAGTGRRFFFSAKLEKQLPEVWPVWRV